ncbi:hypothetical protein HJG60_009218 [Phyllostomus discolor]|uniref:Uncharacterized protein n=1 Tax=Phyllostomus discolor TaxID=89673 RepID=A0A833YPL8_9CHIR|nr:hypothetical protein HJG60_009218 [Phyllostomus discolor]
MRSWAGTCVCMHEDRVASTEMGPRAGLGGWIGVGWDSRWDRQGRERVLLHSPCWTSHELNVYEAPAETRNQTNLGVGRAEGWFQDWSPRSSSEIPDLPFTPPFLWAMHTLRSWSPGVGRPALGSGANLA